MRRLVPTLVIALIVFAPGLAGADDGTFSTYEQRGWAWMFLAAFGFGFLTSLTPCVYPMIPITLAIFGARGGNVTRRRAVVLATIYVLGMALTYSVLGVTFSLLGKAAEFGTQLANPWFVFPLVALFVALAASMFGAFELALPSSVQARLNQIGGKGFGGAFAMGLVGGLIAAPCTGPFLAGLLAFVSTTGSIVGGGALLFVYGIGMGVLFWVLAAFARALPKSGAWMEGVKSAAGIGLLFAALYFASPFVPQLAELASPSRWFLLGALVTVTSGIALGAVHLSFHGSRSQRIRKAIAIALVVGGAFSVWMWKTTPPRHLPWVYSETLAFERARAEGKGVMVDFAAAWCGPCRELELTFSDDEVYDAITDNFIPLRFDVTEDTAMNAELKTRYGSGTLPSIVFMDPERNVLARVHKLMEPDDLLKLVVPASRKLGLDSHLISRQHKDTD